jgi:hypothetical protein
VTDNGLQRRIQVIKDKRARKEEKARYEKLAETMHRKRVERLKRKEKRNKMLKSWLGMNLLGMENGVGVGEHGA